MGCSDATERGQRVVAADADVKRVDDLPNGVRVSTEYPELTRRYFEGRGVEADIRLSYGASEAKIPDIADCIVDITETGRALRATVAAQPSCSSALTSTSPRYGLSSTTRMLKPKHGRDSAI